MPKRKAKAEITYEYWLAYRVRCPYCRHRWRRELGCVAKASAQGEAADVLEGKRVRAALCPNCGRWSEG